MVLLLEFMCEFAQEVFMFLQLVIEHNLYELTEPNFTLKFYLFLLRYFLFSRKFSLWLNPDQMIQWVIVGTSSCLIDSTCEEVCTKFILFRLSLIFNQICHLLYQDLRVSVVIHPHYDFLPNWFIELSNASLFLQAFYQSIEVRFALGRIFFAEHSLEYLDEGVFDMHLNVSEFFIAFVFEDFCEESNLMVIVTVRANSVDYCRCPFYD